MGAGLHIVWLASRASAYIGPISSTGDTMALEVTPSPRGLATIASHRETTGKARAAGSCILSGENLGGITSLDAIAIIESFSGTKCPTY